MSRDGDSENGAEQTRENHGVDMSGAGGAYREQIDRELERVGGIGNVPPLSELIQQLQSQDGNTF